MANASLQVVYRAIITAKLTYAASAWWGRGFTTEADRQRLEAIIRRGKRTDLYSEDHPAIAELVECADDELFDKVLINSPFCQICNVLFHYYSASSILLSM